MSSARDSVAREIEPEPDQPAAAPTAIRGAADPATILARVANDRADPRLVAAIASAAGNRYVARLATRRLARAPNETPTYLDPKSDQSYASILPLLNRTPWGRDALDVMVANKVRTVWASDGPPANFAQTLNRVRLNKTLRADVLSAYFVHEMYHASQFHAGKSPGPELHDDMGRWVKILVDEEIEGTAIGYLHKLQLERTEPRATADDNPAHMTYFRGAFDAGYKEAIGQGKSIEDARADGRARGRKMAEYLIRPSGGDRHRLGVGDWLSYTDYYEHEWKQAHKAPAPH